MSFLIKHLMNNVQTVILSGGKITQEPNSYYKRFLMYLSFKSESYIFIFYKQSRIEFEYIALYLLTNKRIYKPRKENID